uniref:Rab proteins geranylgeranyltransferase component A n=2 Tax=Gouania willdenowi TaxID=441366 RepID=A0A8C5E7H5_GOUWI
MCFYSKREYLIVIFDHISVVAAACSRVGQRVLHLDRRSYYAANWASFTFNGLLSWIQQQQVSETQDWCDLLEEGEELIQLSSQSSIRNLQVFTYTSKEDEVEEASADSVNTTEEEQHGPGETRCAVGSERLSQEVSRTHHSLQHMEIPAEGFCSLNISPIFQSQATITEGAEPEAEQPQSPAIPSQSEPSRKKISFAQLEKEGRRFNIDLVSKLMYSRGSLVELLIKSNVSRYAEFKKVSRILTYRNGEVEQVPCTRADVFASRQLSVVEKRKLMRFLTSCIEEKDDQSAYNGRPYLEFLRDQKLGENLQHFLLYSIAMVTEDTPTEVGLASTRNFLRCLGRYGNTPFLFPLYGLGEIPQCFCRMCAVFGGIYCLRHSLRCLLLDTATNRCKAVIDSRGQRISCSHVLLEENYVHERKNVATPPRFLSRAVLITDSSLHGSDSEQEVSMVTIPPITEGAPAVKMVELSSSTMTCMSGTYLVHLNCSSVSSAYQDLSPLITTMFSTPESHDQGRPSVLWCLYFNMEDGSAMEVEGHDLPSNVYVCSGPDGELGHEHAITQAELIFHKILPEEDFCPPAPNPEDILYDGGSAPSSGPEEEPSLQLEVEGLDSDWNTVFLFF